MPQEEVIMAHDPISLERAIGNLSAYAVKYTPIGGRVQITLKEIDNKLELPKNGHDVDKL